MEFTNDFFIQAQGVIERVFRDFRDELITASGNVSSERKADASRVTEYDKKVETVLTDALQKFDASIGIEGEEFGISGSRQTFWLLDPIDGTDSFIRGLPFFRNMATLIHNNDPVFTVVYKPVSDELFVAAKSEGAYRNGLPIKVSERAVQRARIEVHAPGSRNSTWQLMELLSAHINAIRISGDFLTVAEGKMDGLLVNNGGGGPWDFAPRALLIREAGGRVANFGADTYDYRDNKFLAANPIIFDEIMELIVTHQSSE